MTQYLRFPFTLLLAVTVALLLLQLPHGKVADERNLNTLVLVEGVFNLELQSAVILDPDSGSALPVRYEVATSRVHHLSDALPAYASISSPLTLPPSRAPPTLI